MNEDYTKKQKFVKNPCKVPLITVFCKLLWGFPLPVPEQKSSFPFSSCGDQAGASYSSSWLRNNCRSSHGKPGGARALCGMPAPGARFNVRPPQPVCAAPAPETAQAPWRTESATTSTRDCIPSGIRQLRCSSTHLRMHKASSDRS